MVRATARQQSSEPVGSVTQTGITRSRSATELKLEALQKEHERLLRDIAKRKAACELAEQAARDAATAFQLRVDPMRKAFFDTLKELREIFASLFAPGSRLNKRDRARVRRLYQELMPDLDLDDDVDGDFSAGQRRAERDFEEPPSWHSGARGGERAADPDFSAPRPAEKGAGVLRAVFRRLAIALHPDKVQDAEQKELRTAVMKDITRAYEAGDVARLLEIERSWLAAVPLDDDPGGLLRRIAGLLGANTELRKQLRTLTAQLKTLKQAVPPAPTQKKRRSRTAPTELSETDLLVRDLERELGKARSLRDFARSFVDGTIDIDEFLRGPVAARPSNEDELLELLAEMLADAGEPDIDERRGRRTKRGARQR
jgi:hypothetical protein